MMHFAALSLLADSLAEPGRYWRMFCLGAGISVREVIDPARHVTNRPVPVSGNRRAVEDLGWQPTRSTLPQMIGDAWAWHRSGGFDRAQD